MGNEASIEPAAASDDRAIAAMEADFFPLEAIGARQIGYFRRRDEALTLVARARDGAVLGYLVGTIQRRGAERTFWIVTMAIARSARRQGLGRRLLATAVRWAGRQDVDRIKLQVRVGNRRARALYEGSGFAVTRRLPEYYGEKRDAYLMERSPRGRSARAGATRRARAEGGHRT